MQKDLPDDTGFTVAGILFLYAVLRFVDFSFDKLYEYGVQWAPGIAYNDRETNDQAATQPERRKRS